MEPNRIRTKSVATVYNVAVDGKHYRVVHRVEENFVQPWGQEEPPVVYWRVFGRRGAYGERECEENSPTYKRVIAAVKEMIEPQRNAA